MFKWLKRLFHKNRKSYKLNDVFGCSECPPEDCPTFLVRNVHNSFSNALESYNIVVVYGESRQGKTWTIERYCPQQKRISCIGTMTLSDIKRDMLRVIGTDVMQIDHTITEKVGVKGSANTSIGNEMLVKAGAGVSTSLARTETLTTSYVNVNVENTTEFLNAISAGSVGLHFVFDNFHYLSTSTQQDFCSLLKEFNYRNIKVIIIGVWKDASRITALAPDLLNRCEHIDIGTWNHKELREVVRLGEEALNIRISESIVNMFITCCSNNIGIFKDLLQKFCQNCSITKTQKATVSLNDEKAAHITLESIVYEALRPLQDRIKNLASPNKQKRSSRHLRRRIICAILRIILRDDSELSQNGIRIDVLKKEIDAIFREKNEEKVSYSNISQEIGNLHLREENRQSYGNFIPLFYYDKTNGKLLVIEPTIYVIKAFDYHLLESILISIY